MTTWRGDGRRRSFDAYALVRAAIALLILAIVFGLVAVPFYVAIQVALAFIGVAP